MNPPAAKLFGKPQQLAQRSADEIALTHKREDAFPEMTGRAWLVMLAAFHAKTVGDEYRWRDYKSLTKLPSATLGRYLDTANIQDYIRAFWSETSASKRASRFVMTDHAYDKMKGLF